jgi:hypothetical protein
LIRNPRIREKTIATKFESRSQLMTNPSDNPIFNQNERLLKNGAIIQLTKPRSEALKARFGQKSSSRFLPLFKNQSWRPKPRTSKNNPIKNSSQLVVRHFVGD